MVRRSKEKAVPLPGGTVGRWFLLEPDPHPDAHLPLCREQIQHTEQQHKASQCIMALAGAWVTLSSHTGFSGSDALGHLQSPFQEAFPSHHTSSLGPEHVLFKRLKWNG